MVYHIYSILYYDMLCYGLLAAQQGAERPEPDLRRAHRALQQGHEGVREGGRRGPNLLGPSLLRPNRQRVLAQARAELRRPRGGIQCALQRAAAQEDLSEGELRGPAALRRPLPGGRHGREAAGGRPVSVRIARRRRALHERHPLPHDLRRLRGRREASRLVLEVSLRLSRRGGAKRRRRLEVAGHSLLRLHSDRAGAVTDLLLQAAAAHADLLESVGEPWHPPLTCRARGGGGGRARRSPRRAELEPPSSWILWLEPKALAPARGVDFPGMKGAPKLPKYPWWRIVARNFAADAWKCIEPQLPQGDQQKWRVSRCRISPKAPQHLVPGYLWHFTAAPHMPSLVRTLTHRESGTQSHRIVQR